MSCTLYTEIQKVVPTAGENINDFVVDSSTLFGFQQCRELGVTFFTTLQGKLDFECTISLHLQISLVQSENYCWRDSWAITLTVHVRYTAVFIVLIRELVTFCLIKSPILKTLRAAAKKGKVRSAKQCSNQIRYFHSNQF